MNEAEFKSALAQDGYGEARTVEFEPSFDSGKHVHDFSAMLLITRGEVTLDFDTGPVTYGPGDWCEVIAGTRHAERAGPQGATLLVGRRQCAEASPD